MPRVPAEEHINNRFINGINAMVKKTREQRVQQLKPTAWIAPSFLNSWVNFGGSDAIAGYFIDGGSMVHLKGKVKTGTINTPIFTLPAGYRPSENLLFSVPSNGALGILQVDTSGNVNCISGNNTYVDISGVMFRV